MTNKAQKIVLSKRIEIFFSIYGLPLKEIIYAEEEETHKLQPKDIIQEQPPGDLPSFREGL